MTTNDTWAREKARELAGALIGFPDEPPADLIAAALLSARLAGWREGLEVCAKIADQLATTASIAFAIRALPDPEEPRHD